MADYKIVTVKLWGTTVGYLVEDKNRFVFEYAPDFLHSGLEISPYHMPLEPGPFSFPELTRSDCFQGLPGIFADSLPDRFGHRVLAEYFAKQGLAAQEIPLFAKLLYIGRRGMGALEFEPDESPPIDGDDEMDVVDLWTRSRKVLQGKVASAADQIYRYGGTAGGARAKAIILYNPNTGAFRSPFLAPAKDYQHWLIKFDGVDLENESLSAAQPWERLEYLYNQLARAAGLDVPEFAKVEEAGRFHFLVKRFDRRGDEMIHMASLAGLRHLDYNDQRTVDYGVFLQTIRALTEDARAVKEGFARAVFNVLMQNMDDHVKNHSFLLERGGAWRLSPVYDIVFTPNEHQWFRDGQQMGVGGKHRDITRDDCLALAKRWGINRAGETIERILEACKSTKFLALAEDVGLTKRFPKETTVVANAIVRNGRLLRD